jgi:two-component system NtrC family sensor kinase
MRRDPDSRIPPFGFLHFGWHFGWHFGLAAKLALSLIGATAALFALFGYFNLRDQRRHSEEMVLQTAERITDVIQRSTRYEMLRNDRQALYNVIQELGSEPGIRRIRIFNKEGRITFSTDAAEVNRVVDKRAEACYGCHAQSAPLAKLNRPDRARIFEGKGERLLGMIRPIDNAAVCAGCHPAGQRVLGVIDADLSLAAVDAQTAQHRAHLVVFMALTLAMIWLVSVAFIWGVVYRPVKELTAGTHRVADGDLNYRLPVRSRDEIGDLAASFNKMTAEVAGGRAEIEERVRRKTAELDQAHRSLLANEKMASIGKLAATVAHEVNNPLFGILTYARLTLKEVEKGPAASRTEIVEQLGIIQRESKRCGDIMRNLLTFARQAPSHRESNDLNTLIGRALVGGVHGVGLRRRAGPRPGTRHGPRNPPGVVTPNLRAVLHHQRRSAAHRSGAGGGAQHRGTAWGRDCSRVDAGPGG